MVRVCDQESGVWGRAASTLVLTLPAPLLSQSFFGFPSFLVAESEEAPEFPPISNRPVYRGCVWMVEILEYTGCFNWSIKLYDGARRLAAGGWRSVMTVTSIHSFTQAAPLIGENIP